MKSNQDLCGKRHFYNGVAASLNYCLNNVWLIIFFITLNVVVTFLFFQFYSFHPGFSNMKNCTPLFIQFLVNFCSHLFYLFEIITPIYHDFLCDSIVNYIPTFWSLNLFAETSAFSAIVSDETALFTAL